MQVDHVVVLVSFKNDKTIFEDSFLSTSSRLLILNIYNAVSKRATNASFASCVCDGTSLSSWCSHCLGLSSVARYAIRSKAVSRVCRRDDTKIKTGLAGEWLRMAVNRGSKTS